VVTVLRYNEFMTKIIFAIFAHPDDEAFGGSSAALLQATKNGAELHTITFTAGEAGMNPDNVPDLGATRLEEWRTAATLLGAKSTHYLGYSDGQLTNQTMIEATEKITAIVQEITDAAPADTEIEFITMDLNGLTGHIDHIIASRAACQVFYRLKVVDDRITRLLLACWPRTAFPEVNTSWIFMEPGRLPEEIDETIDARDLRNELTKVVRAHHTQRRDGDGFLRWQGDNLGLCYFIVKR
jgi:LmbE family N-acetylglucosaminyl deacetylase